MSLGAPLLLLALAAHLFALPFIGYGLALGLPGNGDMRGKGLIIMIGVPLVWLAVLLALLYGLGIPPLVSLGAVALLCGAVHIGARIRVARRLKRGRDRPADQPRQSFPAPPPARRIE